MPSGNDNKDDPREDRVGSYDHEDLAMKNEEPIRKGRDFDSFLPRHDEVATNGSYLINLTIKRCFDRPI